MTSHTNSPHLLHEVWGTVVTITIGSSVEPHSHQSPQFDPVLAACRDFMDRIDTIFSPFRPESLVTGYRSGAIRESELRSYHPDHALLIDVIHGCRTGKTMTNGAFDPWIVPGGFNPSGYVKGWACERMARMLKDANINNFCINAGGDVLTRGYSYRDVSTSNPWVIGIRHPHDRDALATTFSVTNGGIATSGTYERGFHIVSPHGGANSLPGSAANGACSASVVGPDAAVAEILSTALVVDGRKSPAWFAGFPQYSAFVVDPMPADSSHAPTAWRIPARF
ncbi:FAD:protein FMN transferase [Arcanobacterium haemolyticum]|uniref:FAD:protein FMN transferase n=1 Tax=Arcanobacterium haemolyticum (strain ATCC 9345 / DSM 20595 / CCM 5947 / CCUG 17215 / LMG 16163 / NBRC 15585 / NCTC 8452 / 11018) TaxID=644284 RepID=D7BPM7_ARCHD|nr:FAD:protein FMN transferase [Arcanobacterium haemolyticum]ADH92876.1 ApbE family lipoprotein [Arcanobacterium haemolyticum DSM 20595]QCX46961.1 FAD:protein FMN transferase [Arcanobacterium haemolyticum]SQH28375.1 Thiamine biosynthesis lipoprotein ApbE precursor [Arcanobacterium haemolyticum]